MAALRERELESLVRGKGLQRLAEIQRLYASWVQGRLVLRDPNPPGSFPEYVLRLDYSLWYWTSISITLAALAAIYTSGALPQLAPLRYALGSIFVLFLPGYSAVRALYPANELSPLEELALSIGLSLAVVPLTGLALNYTPWGIRLGPVAASLAAEIAVLSTIGLYRGYALVKRY